VVFIAPSPTGLDIWTGMDIDRWGPRPVYEQVAEAIAGEISSHLRPGERLPAEDALAARFAVNRHTLRHAVDHLVARGWLERRRGLGTFVCDRPLDYPLHSQTRFSETIDAIGQGHSHGTRMVRLATQAADVEVAGVLGLRPGNTVWRIDTLREIDARPATVITHWLPLEPLPELGLRYRGGSLHACLRESYGFAPRRSWTRVAAQLPTAEEAALLLAPRQLPLLRLRTLNRDGEAGIALEYAVARTRSDRLELRIEH
jgi:GntR family phosphonate transport system transcriptional regulator